MPDLQHPLDLLTTPPRPFCLPFPTRPAPPTRAARSAVYPGPLTLRLRHRPLLAAWALRWAAGVLRPYPSAADLALALSLGAVFFRQVREERERERERDRES